MVSWLSLCRWLMGLVGLAGGWTITRFSRLKRLADFDLSATPTLELRDRVI